MKTENEEYTLKYPVEVAAEVIAGVNGHPDIIVKPATVYTKLVFQPVRGKNMPAIETAARSGNIQQINAVMISELAGIPIEIVGELMLEDFEKAAEIAGSFFPKRQTPPKDGASE